MSIENSSVGSSKSNGIVERAIQSVQGMIRTICSDIEGRWRVKIDATHSIWPWIAEQASFLLMRFGWTRREDRVRWTEREVGKSARHVARRKDLVEEKTSGGPLGKLTCMWRRHLAGGQSDHSGIHRGESGRCVVDENCLKETSQREMRSKQLGNGRSCPAAQK